jgi:hypothetical protein
MEILFHEIRLREVQRRQGPLVEPRVRIQFHRTQRSIRIARACGEGRTECGVVCGNTKVDYEVRLDESAQDSHA